MLRGEGSRKVPNLIPIQKVQRRKGSPEQLGQMRRAKVKRDKMVRAFSRETKREILSSGGGKSLEGRKSEAGRGKAENDMSDVSVS